MSVASRPGRNTVAGMPTRGEWRVFGQWTLVGAASIWATWTLLSYGWVLAVGATIGAVLIARREEPGRSAWGFVAGMGLVPMWVGLINRATVGPPSPWWWVGTGAILAAAGVLPFLRPRRVEPADEPADRPSEGPDPEPVGPVP